MIDDFLKSSFCQTGARCELCRNFENGRKWRESMSKFFKINSLDWACPFGKAWNMPSIARPFTDKRPQQSPTPPKLQPAPPSHVMKVQQNEIRVLTNNEWSSIVAKIDALGSVEDRALAHQIIEQSKSCGCKSRFAGMQYNLWEKYK